MHTVVKQKDISIRPMSYLYKDTVEAVVLILTKHYNMNKKDAKVAVMSSPLKSLFERDAEIAAHTSNEAWARKIYIYWRKRHSNVSINLKNDL